MGYESLPKAAEEELYKWYCSSAHAWGVWAWTPATGAARWVVEPGELLYAWHDGVSLQISNAFCMYLYVAPYALSDCVAWL